MAKYSGSLYVGALKKTPMFKLAISSSLMYSEEAVKYGYSLLVSPACPVGNLAKALPTALVTSSC